MPTSPHHLNDNPTPSCREVFGPINFFGGEYNSHDEARLRATEAGNEDAMIIIVSDCHLDQPKVRCGRRLLSPLRAGLLPILRSFPS